MEIKFLGYNCILQKGQYGNNRIALQLTEKDTGEPIAVCTVNLPELELAPKEVLIKNYSENTGMLEVLTDAKVVRPTRKYVDTGHVRIPVCNLLIDPETLTDIL